MPRALEEGESVKEHAHFDFYKDVEAPYCSHVLNAIHFVDNNLKLEDQKKYLFHIENCTICTRYIKSLRKDFSAIEQLVPKILDSVPIKEEYAQEAKSLVGHLYEIHRKELAQIKKRQWGKKIKSFFKK